MHPCPCLLAYLSLTAQSCDLAPQPCRFLRRPLQEWVPRSPAPGSAGRLTHSAEFATQAFGRNAICSCKIALHLDQTRRRCPTQAKVSFADPSFLGIPLPLPLRLVPPTAKYDASAPCVRACISQGAQRSSARLVAARRRLTPPSRTAAHHKLPTGADVAAQAMHAKTSLEMAQPPKDSAPTSGGRLPPTKSIQGATEQKALSHEK